MFIGDKEVVKEMLFEDQPDLVEITVEEQEPFCMSLEVYEAIKSEEKSSGSITDRVTHYFASKFLSDLAKHNLNFYMAENVGAALGTLAHNAREKLIGKTFDCGGALDIKLSTIVDSVMEK